MQPEQQVAEQQDGADDKDDGEEHELHAVTHRVAESLVFEFSSDNQGGEPHGQVDRSRSDEIGQTY